MRWSIILLISTCTVCFSQNEHELSFLVTENYSFKKEQTPLFTFKDNLNLRKEPSLNSDVVSTLPLGSKIYALEKSTNTLTLFGIKSAWYYVVLNNKKGWVWGGGLTQQALKSTSNLKTMFLFGIIKNDTSTFNREKTYVLKAIQNNMVLDVFTFKSNAHYLSYLNNLGNAGLSLLDDLITIDIPCVGGCGCTTGTHYFFYYNNKFQYQETLYGTADAEYSEYENYIFPISIEGEPYYVIKTTNEVDWKLLSENTNNENIKRNYIKKYFVWDGKRLIPSLSKATQIESYWMKD